MQVLLLGGFLGSGKTTVLLQLAQYLAKSKIPDDGKTTLAIIENEVGSVGIDYLVLKERGYQVRDLLAGCICCTLVTDLITCLQDLKKRLNPEWVIIEATGLAYPGNIAETIYEELSIHSRIVCLVDASRWQALFKAINPLATGQIIKAALILLNKIDLIDDQTRCDIYQSIKKLNANSQIIDVSAKDGLSEYIMKIILYAQ